MEELLLVLLLALQSLPLALWACIAWGGVATSAWNSFPSSSGSLPAARPVDAAFLRTTLKQKTDDVLFIARSSRGVSITVSKTPAVTLQRSANTSDPGGTCSWIWPLKVSRQWTPVATS